MFQWAALMPHPPILVPSVGKGREREAASTLEGLDRLCSALKGAKPGRILLLSPHARQARGVLAVAAAGQGFGDLGAFGAPDVRIRIDGIPEEAQKLAEFLAPAVPAAIYCTDPFSLDHASLIPLYFLSRVWGELPPVVVAGPIGLSLPQALRLGTRLAEWDRGGDWALLASGDLSHRLSPDAPAGYSPAGRRLDRAILEALETGDPTRLLEMPPEEIDEAGECGLRSVLALLGASSGPSEVLSYEGPFGVGYAVALRIEDVREAPRSGDLPREDEEAELPRLPCRVDDPNRAIPALARRAVELHLRGVAPTDPVLAEELSHCSRKLSSRPAACFVSIHQRKDGGLRGCIGTIVPVRPSLKEEILANAVAAAVRDPRFPPVDLLELPGLDFSVDVLEEPELIRSADELDPKVYGVIVSRGSRRGVLLPDLDGVDTVEEQLAIAMRKAGIVGTEGIRVEKFRVRRYEENGR
jgi:AmmeMemoRadiSam system protein A